MIISILLLIASFSGCIGSQKSDSDIGESSPNPSIKETKITDQDNVFFWNSNDWKINKLSGDMQTYLYKNTLYQRPPFYTGAMPLEYGSAYEPSTRFGSPPPLYYKFDSFLNLFVHNGNEVVGAQTLDGNRNIAAEGKVINLIDGQELEIEEIHYSGAKPIFKCHSFIDSAGNKIRESETIGKKEKDYYFIWPSIIGA